MDSPERTTRPDENRRERLQRSKRLRQADYVEVLGKKRAFQGRYVVLCLGPDAGLPHAQIGVVTSRRTLGTAVERNRARRLMREAFRTQQQKIRPGARIVLIARKNLAAGCGLAEVARDFKTLCVRAEVWENKE